MSAASRTVAPMTLADQIKRAFSMGRLLRAWFETLGARRFSARIERDEKAGEWDKMADEALAEHRIPHA
jgi:hypothetical protein